MVQNETVVKKDEEVKKGPRIIDGKEDPNAKQRSYLLVYRHTNRIGSAKGDPLNLMFWFRGDLANARIRARAHCENMHYRYINCRPFIVDLDEREALRNSQIVDDDE